MKRRLSASIDDELLAAAEEAVREGQAPSMSALVEEALRLHVEKTKRLAALGDFVDWLDETRGPVSDEEVERTMREWRAEAIHITPGGPAPARTDAAADHQPPEQASEAA